MSPGNTKRSGAVWILSGCFLLLYSSLGLLNISIPGVEDLVAFMQHTEGWYVYLAAFTAVFFEGLYIVGNFIPGTTFILLAAILAQAGGTLTFLGTILAIFVGWVLAGFINIFLTARLLNSCSDNVAKPSVVNDHFFTTWYPAFRANHEVSQVASGIPPLQAFFSSLRVKIFASGAAALGALILPFIIDIKKVSNDEGFMTVFTLAFICLTVGAWQIYQSSKT
jgi:hypothetical protein